MQPSRIWRKHRSQIIFACLILGSIAANSRDIALNLQSLTTTRKIIATNNTQQQLLLEQLELEKAQAKVAESRYKAGCTIVVAVNSPKSLASLVAGEPVFDRITKQQLPAGTVVCDANGQTGVIVLNSQHQLVVSQMAFTGDRQLAISQIKKIRGAKVFYYTPEK